MRPTALVVGLRGPPVVLLQNTFIVVLVLTAALTVFVHVPYVLGRIHLVVRSCLSVQGSFTHD